MILGEGYRLISSDECLQDEDEFIDFDTILTFNDPKWQKVGGQHFGKVLRDVKKTYLYPDCWAFRRRKGEKCYNCSDCSTSGYTLCLYKLDPDKPNRLTEFYSCEICLGNIIKMFPRNINAK